MPIRIPATASRPSIVVILPRGEAIRNVVYSGTLDQLSAAANLTALSVFPSEDIRRFMEQSCTVQPLRNVPERYVVGALREVLDMAHGRHLWSKAAQERWMVRDSEATTVALKLKRAAKKALCAPFASRHGVELLSVLERSASRSLATADELMTHYRQSRPSLVFNASHVHSPNAIQAVQAAQWLGIPTAAFIFSWDNLTTQGRIIPSYDHYLVWNDDIRRQLLRIYPRVRPEQVHVTGTPQFDFHFQRELYWSREQFCHHVHADPNRPVILYSTGMSNHMPGEDRIVERIADVVSSMTQFGPPQLLVRVYAKDRSGRFDALIQRRKDILFPPVAWEPSFLTPKFEDLAVLTNTLRHCAAGINVASTISLELAMMDKPVINVGYDPPDIDIRPISFRRYYDFDHYKPIVQSGGVEVAYSEQELGVMLKNAIENPARLSGHRLSLTRNFFGDTLDGNAAGRVARILLELATTKSHGQ